ncbi:MAG: hypothetical protein IJR15_01710 [Clostridiales bacterium]|nr:hypothetical protein [Clostridiales bacterium]
MNKKTAVFFTIFTMAFCLCGCAADPAPAETVHSAAVTAPTQEFTFTVYDPNGTEETEEYVPRERSIPEDDEFSKFSFEEDGTCILPGTQILFTLPPSYSIEEDTARVSEGIGGPGDERRFLFAAADDDVGYIYVIYMGPYNFMNSSLQDQASDMIDSMNESHIQDGGYTNVYTIDFEMDGHDCEAYGVLALYSNYPEFTQIAFLVGDHDTAYYVFCQNAIQDQAEDIIFRFEEQA